MYPKNISVAIIGAGASGTILAYQLIDKACNTCNFGVKVFLIEKSGDFGPGLAYSTPLSSHILNMRSDTLGVKNSKPSHFFEWLKEKREFLLDDKTSGSYDMDYPPRKIYGLYLKELLDLTIKRTKSGPNSVNLIRGAAVDIDLNGGLFRIKMADGSTITSDNIVLAPGNFPSSFLYELKGLNGYIPYPWPVLEITEKIPRDNQVCIIGAGLTAIDTLFTLLENDHRGKIAFISRRGFLPKVQGKPFEYELKYISKEKILKIISGMEENKLPFDLVRGLFLKEMETAENKEINWLRVFNPQGSTIQILEEDIARAESGIIPYQAALTSSGPLTGYIWNSMSVEDRMRFEREYKTVWTVYRHPMPLINAKKILSILKSGQLDIVSGYMCVRTCGNKGFEIDIDTSFGVPYKLKTAYIINATGQGTDITKFNDILLNRLLDKGLIFPHANGGIDTDFFTSEIKGKNARLINGFFALGEITKGVHFFTNGIVPNMNNSEKIADLILSRTSN